MVTLLLVTWQLANVIKRSSNGTLCQIIVFLKLELELTLVSRPTQWLLKSKHYQTIASHINVIWFSRDIQLFLKNSYFLFVQHPLSYPLKLPERKESLTDLSHDSPRPLNRSRSPPSRILTGSFDHYFHYLKVNTIK